MFSTAPQTVHQVTLSSKVTPLHLVKLLLSLFKKLKYNWRIIYSLQVYNMIWYFTDSKMFTTISLVNIHHHTELQNFAFTYIVQYCLLKSQCIHVLHVTPHVICPGFICLTTGNLYLLTTFTHFIHTPYPFWKPSRSLGVFCIFFHFLIPHISEIIQYCLSLFDLCHLA